MRERLRHAGGDEDHGGDEREGQEDVDERAVQVAPEVPDRPRLAAREAAEERDHRRDADAAETKFCTASPAIWVRYDIVDSPA